MKPNWRIGLFALALWAQLIFGVSMTLWRGVLTFTQDWQIYSVTLPADLDRFSDFAVKNIPARESVGYLTPPSDNYIGSYARLAVWLYPRRLLWLGTGPIKSPITGWMPVDLREGNWIRQVRAREIHYLLLQDLGDLTPCQARCIPFDATRSLWVIE